MITNKKQGFTLVELIVVITILAILGTIAFISLQGYSRNSRDSVRISDISKIQSGLELFQIGAGKYPNTTGGEIITFSGSVAWYQGTFGTDTFKNISRLDKIPTDPLTGKEYTYSITNKYNEYQLASIMEGDEYVLNTQVNALNKTAFLRIIGNYNGQILRVDQNILTYILAVPSIITSTGGKLTDIINNGYLSFNGYKNLPFQYKGTSYNALGEGGGITLTQPNKFVVYSGSLNTLQKNKTARINLITNLKTSYVGTLIENNGQISNLTKVDLTNASSVENIGSTLVNNNLNGNIILIPTQTPAPPLFVIDQDPNCISTFTLVPELLDGVQDYYVQSCTGLKWEATDTSGAGFQWATSNSYTEPKWNGTSYDYPIGRVETNYPAFKYCTDKGALWRLPTKKEMFSIMTDIETNTSGQYTQLVSIESSLYWSSTVFAANTNFAGYCIFGAGNMFYNSKTGNGQVLCIHD